MQYDNRVVVITGANGGLGRMATRAFARAGARLALFSRDEDRLRQLSGELELADERVLTAGLDFGEAQAARTALDLTLAKFGQADILLHLVGGWTGGKTLVESEAGQLEQMLNQHVWTTFHLARAFLPHFLARDWGRMVVISSPNAGLPRAKGSPYAAAKAAQESLVLSIAQEVKGTGVTANVIRVNAIDVAHSRKDPSWSTPEEICAALFYLCSAQAGLVNGARLPLYGSP